MKTLLSPRIAALGVGILVSVLIMVPLAFLPAHSAIRPMGEAAQSLMWGVVMLGIGVWFCVKSLLEGQKVLALVCFALSIVPFPAAIVTIRVIVHLKDLTLKP